MHDKLTLKQLASVTFFAHLNDPCRRRRCGLFGISCITLFIVVSEGFACSVDDFLEFPLVATGFSIQLCSVAKSEFPEFVLE